MEREKTLLKSLIAANEVEQVFERLLSNHSLPVSSHLQNEIILKSNDFTSLREEKRKNLISNEEYYRGIAKINDSLLRLIDSIPLHQGTKEKKLNKDRSFNFSKIILFSLGLIIYLVYFLQSTIGVDSNRLAFDIAGVIILILLILSFAINKAQLKGIFNWVILGLIIIWGVTLSSELLNKRQVTFISTKVAYDVYFERVTPNQGIIVNYLGKVSPSQPLKVRLPVGKFINLSFKNPEEPEDNNGDVLEIPRFWIPLEDYQINPN